MASSKDIIFIIIVVDWDNASIIGTAKTDLQLVYKETFLIFFKQDWQFISQITWTNTISLHIKCCV